MKRLAVVLMLVLSSASVFALQYENPMLNMTVPSGLEQGRMYFTFEHNFYQTFHNYPSTDFLALLDNGANMNISLRYLAIAGLEISAGYTVLNREKLAGLSYVLKFPDIYFNVQANIQLFSYHDFVHDNEDTNLFYSLAIQSEPMLDDRLIFSLDAAYDGYNENIGLAIGASFKVLTDIALLGEYYYPVVKIDGANSAIGAAGIYFFGFKIQTSGHQFIFKFGNSYEMGMRRLMMGTKNLDMYAGFEIMRLIVF
jgi:hypothetical protein